MKKVKYTALTALVTAMLAVGGCASASSSTAVSGSSAADTSAAQQSSEQTQTEVSSDTQAASDSDESTQGTESSTSSQTAGGETSESGEAGTQIPNPWQNTDSLEEAQQGSGIDIIPPEADVISEYPDLQIVQYRYMEGLIEVDYSNNNDEVVIRKSSESSGDDLAGDYSTYSSQWEETFMGLTITCKGDGTLINLAEFGNNDYAYAVECNIGDEGNGISVQTLQTIIENMQ